MVKSSRQKEDQLLIQIKALIGFLETKAERVEKSQHGPVEVAELITKVDEVWSIFERREPRRGVK